MEPNGILNDVGQVKDSASGSRLGQEHSSLPNGTPVSFPTARVSGALQSRNVAQRRRSITEPSPSTLCGSGRKRSSSLPSDSRNPEATRGRMHFDLSAAMSINASLLAQISIAVLKTEFPSSLFDSQRSFDEQSVTRSCVSS